jgi:glycosyltransferase involved in cell wall biosynthesis
MTLRAVAPATDLYTDDDGRRSIAEAVGFGARALGPLARRADHHDVVVASVFPYFPVLAARLATAVRGTPLVTTWHEVWGDYWREYIGALAPFGRSVEWLTARCPQYPVAVSDVTARRLARIGQEHERIETVPNGIDYDGIRGTKPVPDGFDVLFAGRLITDKRVDRLLRAFDRAAPADATLGVVGDGPAYDELTALAADLDAADRITFTGFLDEYDDVVAHMRAADVFASPSTREGFGITYVEAMAAGCAVIGADHADSAAAEVIGSGGFLVDPDVDSLADALDRTLAGDRPPTDPTERAQQFDWDAVASRAERVYAAAAEGSW